MGKASNKKNKKDVVVSPFHESDLSLEKRVALYQEEFDKWKKEMADRYGLTLGVELTGYPKALVPQMVLLDLMKNKKDGQGSEKQG